MGNNRRSRRRSAARILNPASNPKRPKLPPIGNIDENTVESFPNMDGDLPDHNDQEFSHDNSNQQHILEEDSNIMVLEEGDDNIHINTTNPGSSINNQAPVTFSSSEICSYELMTLLDNAGCPLNTYERVVSLLKKQEKRGFSYSKAHSRDKLLRLLRQKFHCPTIHSSNIRGCEVFSFPFLEMLQDLVDSSGTSLHRITPLNVQADMSHGELWNTDWMKQTFRSPHYESFNETSDIMLPLILYLDKTGTDVLQRYSLEPLLFTVAALKRETRESRRYWRHLGFIPSSKTATDSTETLSFYHQCLHFILDGIRQAQNSRPLIRVKNIDGSTSNLHVHVPLMIVTGDQLSQDTLCCRRKANAGGAGRVHRSCMCSYVHSDDPLPKCVPVPKSTIDYLLSVCNTTNDDIFLMIDKEEHIPNKVMAKSMNSRTMKYLLRQKKLFTTILSKPFTVHPVVPAFQNIDFGAWKNGIYDATFDDFMHSFEEGMMENIGSTLFDGLVATEADRVEAIMIPLLGSIRSSVRSTFPRWRLQKGFSRQTLMTMGERVGSVFSLALGLHNEDLAYVFQCGHERQRSKYLSFPNSEQDCPMFFEQYIHPMTIDECRRTLGHVRRHGVDISILELMDPFQINQFLYYTSRVVDKVVYPESYPEFRRVGNHYDDMGDKMVIEQRIMNLVHTAINGNASQILKKHRNIAIDGVVPKHNRKKEKQKGDGSTSAFLGQSASSLISLLEYTLCYHAFCKYSSSLPPLIRRDLDLLEYSGRSLLVYFSKMIYRGDGSIDSRTTKVHAQRRFGHNFRAIGNVMHACCEVGERLLKTEAKKISRTAQQRGCTTFERQTCSRILDRHLLDKMGVALSQYQFVDNTEKETGHRKSDSFSRQHPHFIIRRDTPNVLACDRKGNRHLPDLQTGHLKPVVVRKILEDLPEYTDVEVYCEVVLRDGSCVRAFENFRGEGPWYDFVNVQWEDENGASYLLPAQCLAFYKKNNGCMAVVQSVDQDSVGKVPRCMDSVLTTHYHMQCTKSGVPVLYCVNCASIDSPIMAIDHKAGTMVLDESRTRSVMIVRPRNEWAYAWYAWNQYLMIKNKNRTLARPYVNLGTETMVSKVRGMIRDCILEHGRDRMELTERHGGNL